MIMSRENSSASLHRQCIVARVAAAGVANILWHHRDGDKAFMPQSREKLHETARA